MNQFMSMRRRMKSVRPTVRALQRNWYMSSNFRIFPFSEMAGSGGGKWWREVIHYGGKLGKIWRETT